MTKEELIEWIKGCIEYSVDEYNTQTNVNNKAEAFGFLADLEAENEELKEENKELKVQIEKMKCPQNCKNGSVYNWSDNSICMDCEKVSTLHEDNWQEMCKGCKYWELRR